MINSILINMAFLISFISVGGQLQKKYGHAHSSTTLLKSIFGVFAGCLGITLMIYGVRLSQNTLMDFRYVAIIIASIFGGDLSVILCGIIIVLFRILYFGLSYSSIVGAVTIIAVAISCIIIAKFRFTDHKKWVLCTLTAVLLSSISFCLVLNKNESLLNLLVIYIVSFISISFFTFYYVRYILQANHHFRKLQQESTKDYLTGLNNVRKFDDLFNKEVKNALEKQQKLSLLMIDIDFFKKVNDTYGHQEGDHVLIELCKILIQSCRSGDFVSRNGGEEFTVLLINCSADSASQIAENIRINIEAHDFLLSNGEIIKITVSIGVSCYPETTHEIEKLLEKSDMALYNAKHTGRNRVSIE